MSEHLHFYKFKPIDKWLIDAIVNCSIYASKPENLNDPFDCQIDLEKAFEQAISSATGQKLNFIKSFYENKEFIENWKHEISLKGVYSFSFISNETLSNPLMWSHYADEHRGVCLEYIIPKQFIIDNLISPNAENNLVLCNKVEYQNSGIVNAILEAPQELRSFTQILLSKYLLTKNISWQYENEGRLILKLSGSIKLPKTSLHRVYFGLRSNESDITLITKLAKNYSGCNSFYKLTKDNRDYQVNFQEIEPTTCNEYD
ncbi:MAG: hypothetical protein H6R05_501 [Burkholderiaceae bacterium]|nr:hypothetical protein [Burkholderiaceae bacterium]